MRKYSTRVYMLISHQCNMPLWLIQSAEIRVNHLASLSSYISYLCNLIVLFLSYLFLIHSHKKTKQIYFFWLSKYYQQLTYDLLSKSTKLILTTASFDSIYKQIPMHLQPLLCSFAIPQCAENIIRTKAVIGSMQIVIMFMYGQLIFIYYGLMPYLLYSL